MSDTYTIEIYFKRPESWGRKESSLDIICMIEDEIAARDLTEAKRLARSRAVKALKDTKWLSAARLDYYLKNTDKQIIAGQSRQPDKSWVDNVKLKTR